MTTSFYRAITSLFAISLLLFAFAVPTPAQKNSRLQDATKRSGEAAADVH